MAPSSVTISAWPLLLVAVMSTGAPGSRGLSPTRSQLAPPSVVCSKMAGLPTIHPSWPLKDTELNL